MGAPGDGGSSRAGCKTAAPERGWALLLGLSLSGTWERPTREAPLLWSQEVGLEA